MSTLARFRRFVTMSVTTALAFGAVVVTAATPAAAQQDPNCPPPGSMPPPTGLTPLYTDSNVNVFVGGDFYATASTSGVEGLLVVSGNATTGRSPGTVHVGTLPEGSQITPPPGSDMMVVGGNVSVSSGDVLNIGAGSVDQSGNLVGGNLAVGQVITNSGVIETNNGAIENPSQAIDQYADFPNRIGDLSSQLAAQAGTPAEVTGAVATFVGDNTTNQQVFTISAADLPNIETIQFTNIAQGPDGQYAPIVVNVVGGPTTVLNPSSIWINGERVDDPYSPQFGNAAAAIMWNFPGLTDVRIGEPGAPLNEVLGSILVPSTTSEVTVYDNTYGRVYVMGDLTVAGEENALHAYPWLGNEVTTCVTAVVPTATVDITKNLTPGSFLDYYYNPQNQLARFHGTVTCELPTGEIYTETFTVRANESFSMQGLPVDATCTVTEDLALTDQDQVLDDFQPVPIGEWVWARPTITVDGVVTQEFTTSEGVQQKIELTNTLLGTFELAKHAWIGWVPDPFKIIWRAYAPDGTLQDGYVVPDGDTVADLVPGTSQGQLDAFVGQGGFRPTDPATGRPLYFPAGTEIRFDEVYPSPVPGYEWAGMDYWPNPVMIGPNDAVTHVDMNNHFVPAPITVTIRKEVTGDAAYLVPPETQFVIDYSVNGDPRGPIYVTPNSDYVNWGDIRYGDHITVSEQTPPAIPGVVWGEPVFEPAQDFYVDQFHDLVITVRNEARLADASFQIRKELTGDGAQFVPPDAEFTVAYTVNGVPAPTPLTIRADGTIVDGPVLKHDDVIAFTEVTPPAVQGVAWGAVTIDPQTLTLNADDPVLVTVTNEAVARTGSFQIKKDLAGDGAALVPPTAEFTVTYSVNGVPANQPLILLADGTIVDGPAGLVEGSVVTFTEVTPPAIPGLVWVGAEISPESITIVAGQTPLVTVTNTYSRADATFQIHKEVTGEAAGLVPPETEFTVEYWVNGEQADTPLVIRADGTVVNGPILKHGDLVRFAEVGRPELPGVVWGPVTIDPGEIVLDAEASPQAVTVTNETTLADASFGIRKMLTGEAIDLVPLDTAFTVNYSVNGVPSTTPLTILANGAIVDGPVLKHGDVVTFTEATPPDVPGVTWGPVTIDPTEITLAAGVEPPLVTVTNEATRSPASFQVRKALEGTGTGLVPPETEFTVEYWVNGEQADTPLVIRADGTVVNGPVLEHGDVVTFAEAAPPPIAGIAWGPVRIEPGELTLEEGTTPVVTVTDTADLASATFQIRKALTGGGSGMIPPDTEFVVDYSVNGQPAGTLTVLADGTVVDGPPLNHGDVVTFSERPPPPIVGVTWGPVTIDPPELVLDAEAETPLVTVTNEVTLNRASFQVRKELTGGAQGAVPPDAEFTVEYTVNGVPADDPLVIRADGAIVDSPDFNHGDWIVIEETTQPTVPDVVWGAPVVEPAAFMIEASSPVLVTVTNEADFAEASFRIRKELTGDGADLVPGNTPFTVSYTVNGVPAATPLTILADGTVVDGPALSHGDVITFTEATPPTVPGVAWGEPTIDPEETTLDAEGEPVLVTVTNEARSTLSALTVVKLDEVSEAPLTGAEFDLVLDNGDGSYDPTTDEVVGSCVTAGEDGSCTIDDLRPGTYFWVETAAPAGYSLPAEPVSDPIVVEAGAEPPPTTFADPRLRSTLTVRKIDADTEKPLLGGAFELRRTNGSEELVGTCTTGANGECSLTDLDFGTYLWFEATAPDGYVLPEDRTSQVITIDASNAGETQTFTFADKAAGSQPPAPPPAPGEAPEDTGDLSDTGTDMVIPLAAGIVLLAGGALSLLAIRRRRRS